MFRLRRLICGFGGLLLVQPVMVQDAGAADADPPWLQRVNTVRVASGLAPVTDNASWTAGIVNHLNYLNHELRTPTMTGAYASAHTENPASLYYTAAGDHEARRSNLAYGTRSDVDAIDVWLAAPFHAIGILRPGVAQMGFARAANGDAGLNVSSGLTSSPAITTPIVFPGAGSTIALDGFHGEAPDPTETCEHVGKAKYFAGLPMIAMLPHTPDASLTATLRRPDGSTVNSDGPDLCVVSEFNYFSTDAVYGPNGLAILRSDRAVLVIPRERLTKGAYSVALAAPGMPDVAWSFQAVPPPKVRRAPTPKNVKRPSITGHVKTRKVLTAHPGRWSVQGNRFHYQWLRDGRRILGATGRTYTLKKKDRRHKIRIRVTTKQAGSRLGHALSNKTRAVK